VEANLHTQWDLYGSFCFVPAEDDAKAMAVALHRINEQWQKLWDASGVCPLRPLDVSQLCLSTLNMSNELLSR